MSGLALAEALFFATAGAYAFASVLFGAHLFGIGQVAKELALAPRVLAVGCFLHAAEIGVTSFVTHTCPVASVHFALSVVAMMACATYVVLRTRFHIEAIGAFVAPLGLTFLLASRFVVGGADDSSARVRGVLLPVHVAANVLGDALFMLAFGAAILYLVQESRIKQKKLEGVFQRLPPLDALDRAEHRFLLAGFPLLTIGILTGTVWARRVEMGNAADLWRAAFGYLSWILFAGVLLLRAAAGWRGRRAAYGTIAGFGFALLVLLLYLLRSHAAGGPVA